MQGLNQRDQRIAVGWLKIRDGLIQEADPDASGLLNSAGQLVGLPLETVIPGFLMPPADGRVHARLS
jgi:hypothetical protein